MDNFTKEDLEKLQTKAKFLSEVPLSRLKIISLSKISPILFQINPKTLELIQDALLSRKSTDDIKMHMTLSFQELDGLKTITQEQILSREQAMSFYGIFLCRGQTSIIFKDFVGMFLKVIAGAEGLVSSMVNENIEDNDDLSQDLVLSAVCKTDLKTPYIEYFTIESTEKAEDSTVENQPITFYVIGKNYL